MRRCRPERAREVEGLGGLGPQVPAGIDVWVVAAGGTSAKNFDSLAAQNLGFLGAKVEVKQRYL
jgi:hypothetical protein